MTKATLKSLIRKACNGDRQAFDRLINEYYEMMYKAAFKWCGSAYDAEDIVHNAFLKMAENLNSFRFKSSFETWLYRLVINAAKDYVKKRSRHQGRHQDIDDKNIPSTSQTDQLLQAKDLLGQLHKLPEGEMEAIMLVCAHGHTHKEAANILNCKESTVSWRIHEARKKLEHIYGES
ncbi:MAG: RNA polymerase sigma factor [Alphaproteobacteria bacterium]